MLSKNSKQSLNEENCLQIIDVKLEINLEKIISGNFFIYKKQANIRIELNSFLLIFKNLVNNRIQNNAQSTERVLLTNPWEDFENWNDYLLASNREILLKIQDWLNYGKKKLLPLIQYQQAAIQAFYEEQDCFLNNEEHIKPKRFLIPKHPIEEMLEKLNEFRAINKSVKDQNLIFSENKFQPVSIENINLNANELRTIKAENALGNSSEEPNNNNILTEKINLDQQLNLKPDLIPEAEDPIQTESLLRRKTRSSNKNNTKIKSSAEEPENDKRVKNKKRKTEIQTEINLEIKQDCNEQKINFNEKEYDIENLLNAWKSDYSANPFSTDLDFPYCNDQFFSIDSAYAKLSSPDAKNIDYQNYYQDYYDDFNDKESEVKILIDDANKLNPQEERYIHINEIIISNPKIKNEFEKFKQNYFLKNSSDKMCTCKYALVRRFLSHIGQEASEKNVFLTWGFNSFRKWLKDLIEFNKDLLICFDENCENRKLGIICNQNTCSIFKICANKIEVDNLKRIENNLFLYKKVDGQKALFTNVPIKTGEFLIEFIGELIMQNQTIKIDFSFEKQEKIKKINDCFYLDSRQKGNLSRFINVHKEPNCKLIKCFKRISKNKVEFHLFVSAIKPIAANQELTIQTD